MQISTKFSLKIFTKDSNLYFLVCDVYRAMEDNSIQWHMSLLYGDISFIAIGKLPD